MNRPLSVFAIAAVTLVTVPVTCAGQTRQEQAAAILARVDSPANWTARHPLPPGPTVIIIRGRPEDGPFGPLRDLPPTAPLSTGSEYFGPAFVFAPFSSHPGGHHAPASSSRGGGRR
jgi:hypothetical protein